MSADLYRKYSNLEFTVLTPQTDPCSPTYMYPKMLLYMVIFYQTLLYKLMLITLHSTIYTVLTNGQHYVTVDHGQL